VERKGYTVYIHTAGVGGGERDIQCMSQVQSTGSGMGYTLLVQCKCWRKVSPASAFILIVSCLSSASAFWH
jgi:hypothetical protein